MYQTTLVQYLVNTIDKWIPNFQIEVFNYWNKVPNVHPKYNKREPFPVLFFFYGLPTMHLKFGTSQSPSKWCLAHGEFLMVNYLLMRGRQEWDLLWQLNVTASTHLGQKPLNTYFARGNFLKPYGRSFVDHLGYLVEINICYSFYQYGGIISLWIQLQASYRG